MENLLDDTRKFEKNNDGISNFAVNQEKGFDNIFKKLVASNGITKETGRSLKPVWTGPCIMHGLWKGHKYIIDSCPPLWLILSAINTPTYKLAKFLVPILKCLTTLCGLINMGYIFAILIFANQRQEKLYFACDLKKVARLNFAMDGIK